MKPEAAVSPHDPTRARRSVWLALAHAGLALAVLGAFVWAQVHRG